MDYFKLKGLKEERARDLKAAESILENAQKEGRDLNAEEQQRFDNHNNNFERLTKEINRLEAVRAMNDVKEREMGMTPEQLAALQDHDEKQDKQPKGYTNAFERYMIHGYENLSPKEREILNTGAATQTSTTTGGGYTIPEGFFPELEVAMKRFGNVESVARVVTTTTGNDIPYPNTNDTSRKGRLISENTDVTAGTNNAVAFGSVVLKAYNYTSDLIQVPRQLLQDSAFSMDALLGDLLGTRLGRIKNEHLTTGTGDGQPQGIVTAATEGKVTASTTAFTRPEILDLIYSLDPAYANAPGAGHMISWSTLKAIRSLKIDQAGTTDVRPIYQASAIAGEPDTIEGKPFVLNYDMDDAGTAGNVFWLFGDMSKYMVRNVKGIEIMRLNERYAESYQVAFVGFARWSGHMIDAGTHPIKYMAHAPS